MNHEKLEQLLTLFAKGEISKEAYDQLFQCIREDAHQERVANAMDHVFGTVTTSDKLSEQEIEALYQKVLIDAVQKSAEKRETAKDTILGTAYNNKSTLWYKLGIAASILLLISTGLYFYRSTQPLEGVAVGVPTGKKATITPGGNKAILTLSDGSRIILENAKNGILANQAGMNIQKTSDGKLLYSFSNSADFRPEERNLPLYNKIETPTGGKYQIHLPDGSKVWLNSSSSLRYPAIFVGNTREVELTGEAFFDIAKDKSKPFKVITRDQVVEVLGTQFNINSYDDGDDMNTTLIEGSVKIFYKDKVVLLSPGQQFRPAKINTKVIEANTEEVIAWKNGFFLFKDENIQSIMRNLSRWYDVEVAYEGEIPTVGFGGNISRSKDISEVLDVLQLTNAVHFKVQGRRITVMP